MGRVKNKPIVVMELNNSARNTLTPSSPTPGLPTSAPIIFRPQPSQLTSGFDEADTRCEASEEQAEPLPPAGPPSRLAPPEGVLTCPQCQDTFLGSHIQRYRDHVESCAAEAATGPENESDEDSATDHLTTPPQSDGSAAEGYPSAYSATEVELYPTVHEDDTEAEEVQPRYRLAKLTDIGEFEESFAEAEEGPIKGHFRALQNGHRALVAMQDEWMDLERVAKTTRLPPSMSIEDELDRERGRLRGFPRDPIKPLQRVINPRAKPVRSDDPEKWFPTNQHQLDQDRLEAAVYGYLVKEGAKDIGHQDPIGQRPRGPGQARDLRARQPQRNAVGDDESGDESGLNAVNELLLEGGRGKREKKPSTRIIGTNSRASSVDVRAKPPRKNAKSRLAELEADPSAAETLDSTQHWVDDVDAGDGSGTSDDDTGVAKPHKGPKWSYLDPKTKKIAAGKKGKSLANNDSLNGELDDDEAAAAAKARSQKRSEGAKMGWAKRKEALAAKESTQASVNGDGGEDSQNELAKLEPNDASDANSAIKAAPKKKEKKMIQLPDGTWIEKPSAATINMRRRWQKKREAEAKGLPPPKIGRYKKTDVILAESSSAPADFNDHNDQVLAAVDRAATKKRKEAGRDDTGQNDEDDQQDEADKKTGKGTYKRRKKNQELSDAMVLDDNDTINDDTLGMNDDDQSQSAQPSSTKRGKRAASQDIDGPPTQRLKTNNQPRNSASLASSDEEDEVTEDEEPHNPSSSPKKRAKTGGREKGTQNKKKKGTHIKKPDPVDSQVTGRPPRLGSFVRPTVAHNRNTCIAPVFIDTELPDPMDLDVSEDETEEEQPFIGFRQVPSGISTRPPGHHSKSSSSSGAKLRLSNALSISRSKDYQRPIGMPGHELPEDSGPDEDVPGPKRLLFAVPNTPSNPHPPVYPPSKKRPDYRLPQDSGDDDVASKEKRWSVRFKQSPKHVPVDKPSAKPVNEAPKPSQDKDLPGVRRSSRARKAPVKEHFVDNYDVPDSSPPVVMRPPPLMRSTRRNIHEPAALGKETMKIETETNGEENNDFVPREGPATLLSKEFVPSEDDQDEEIQRILWEGSRASTSRVKNEAPLGTGPATFQSSNASGQTSGLTNPEAQTAQDGSLDSARPARTPELATGNRSSEDGQSPATPAENISPKRKSTGIYKEDNWLYVWDDQYSPEFDNIPKFDKRGNPIIDPAVIQLGGRRPKRERQKSEKAKEAEAPQSPAIRGTKRSNDSPVSGNIKRAKIRGPTALFSMQGSVNLTIRTASPAPSSVSFPKILGNTPTPPEADRGATTATEKVSSSKASGNKGEGKANVEPSNAVAAVRNPNPSHETPAPTTQPPVEQESVTGSSGRPRRKIKPPVKYEDEGEIAEEQREKTPSGTGKPGPVNPANEWKGVNALMRKQVVRLPGEVTDGRRRPSGCAEEFGATAFANHAEGDDPTHFILEAPASASKKKNKGKQARKSDAKAADQAAAEADSPVASIEENDDDDMNSSQKTVVDPEVAEALAKREAARQAKSEKMKAITKARWASGEMHSVMEKKKANNALKKAALTAGTNAPIAIAPAPLTFAAVPKSGLATMKKGGSGSPATENQPPITPTLGGFSSKAKGKTTKPEPKKETRTKVLAKAEGNQSRRNTRGLSTEMDGSSDDHPTSAPAKVKKLTDYEIFQQLSSGGAMEDNEGGKGATAKSITLGYEGRRSGRGGSLGGVGMERQISDEGVLGSGRKSKTVPRKLSEYEMFQQISSPSAAGSPLPPRGRRPAALRASQTFGRFAEDESEEVEEETIPYAGPPGHIGGHRRTESSDTARSTKKDNGKGKVKAAQHKQVKLEPEEEEDDSEDSSEDDEPKKRTLYDEWQAIINNGGDGAERGGKRKRGRKSDAPSGR